MLMNTSYPRLKATLVVASLSMGLAALATSAAFAQTLVNDTNPGLNRTNAPTASNAQWFVGNPRNDTTSSETSALSVTTGTGGGSFLGYFTAAASPVALTVGQTLTVSYTFSLSNIGTATGATALRLGFFDSAGSRASDGYASPDSAFTDYTGYAALLSTRASASGITLRERITGSGNFLNATGNPPFSAALTTAASQLFVAGVSYTVTMTAARTGEEEVSLGVALSGGAFANYSVTYADITSPTLSFDTVGIGWAPNTLAAEGVVTMENLSVSVIPEPASYAALFGLAALGCIALRRRQPSES